MTDRPRPDQRGTIEAEMRTSATPEQLWQAWTNPERLSEWFTDDARGDVQPGGTYTWIFEQFGEMPYRVVEVVEGERLVLGPAPGAPPFVLEITIEHRGGETVLRLVNSGFDAGADFDEEYDGIVSGWRMALGVLRHYVEHQFGKPRTGFLVMRPAAFEYARALGYFTEPDRLARWLTTEGGVGPEGSPVRLSLRGGRTLTGEVLVATERELTLTWKEINGVLELKAFAAGPAGRMLCVRGCGWELPREAARAIQGSLEASLNRLVQEMAA